MDPSPSTSTGSKPQIFKFSVLTLNTYLLNDFAALVVNSSSERNLRYSALQKNLVKYDIIGLQEVFDDSFREELLDSFKKTHPFQISPPEKAFREDGGITLLSKFKIEESFKTTFTKNSGTEILATKGVIYARIHLYKRLHIGIALTHLQSGNSEEAISTRQFQLAQLTNFVNRKARKGDDILFLGDFNSDEANPTEFTEMISLLHNPVDIFRRLNPKNPGYTFDSRKNILIKKKSNGDDTRLRLDYIFQKKISGLISPISCKVEEFMVHDNENSKDLFISDHFGVSAIFRAKYNE